MIKNYISILLIIFIIGCTNKENATSDERVHPNAQNLVADHAIEVTVSPFENGWPDGQSQNSTFFRDYQEGATVGELYGSDNEMFGQINDIAVDSFGRIFLLDMRQQAVHVFTENGEFVTKLGGRGQGPGELERTHSVANYNDEILVISNGSRLELYDISAEAIEFIETKNLDIWSQSLCIMDDKLFVNATNLLNEIGENDDQIHMIHAYQLPEFEPLFSFGDSYKSAHPMVIDRLTTGAISCDKETSTVMFGFMTSPMLHGYAAEDGQLKWKTRVDNLNFVEIFMIEQDGRPGLRYSYENRGNLRDSMLRPVSLGDGQAVFQIQRMQVTEEDVMEMDPEISIISLILNVENGEAEVMSEELPIILGATGTFVSTIANNRVHVTMWHH